MNTLVQKHLLRSALCLMACFCAAAGATTTNIIWAWANVPFDHQMRGITYVQGLYIAVGDSGDIWTSPTGVSSWTKRYTFPAIPDSHASDKSLEAVCYAAGQFVAVGGYVNSNRTQSISWVVTSTNGIDWEDRHVTNFYKLYDVTYGTGQFVAVGGYFVAGPEQVIIASTNGGVAWAKYPEIVGQRQLKATTYANNRFVAVGQAPSLTDATLWTLDAGATQWVLRASHSDYAQLYDVIYARALFFAVGEAACIRSTDGLAWTMPVADTGNPLPTAHFWLRAVTEFDGAFVGAGDYGNVQVTADNGVHWSETYYPPGVSSYPNSLYDIVYTNDMLLAVGPLGKVLTGAAAPEPSLIALGLLILAPARRSWACR